MSNFNNIQELLRKKADLQTRLSLIPYTGTPEIKEYKSGVAFYDFDCATIFFINEQGRLDYYLPIFDKWMKKINTSRLINRLLPVCDSYYEGTKDNIISELYNMSLISEKMKKILENKTL